MCASSFNLLGLTVPEKRVTNNFNVCKLGRKKNERDEYAAAAWFRYTRYICPLSTWVPSSNLLGLTVPEKRVTKNVNVWKLERKKNEKKQQKTKGQNMSSSMIPVHTIHPPIFHMCNKFEPSRAHSSWEKCNEKIFLMFENWRERKIKNKGTNKQQQPDSDLQDTSSHRPHVYQVSIF